MLSNYLFQISQDDIQNYLTQHENDDERELVLKQREINGIPSSLIATQLSGRKKSRGKLPTWYNSNGVVYPPSINLEQCSSEATATFKINLINSMIDSKNTLVDLTGGFGVDSFFLSREFPVVHYVEPNQELLTIAKHNHHRLGGSGIIHHCITAEEFIQQTNILFDLVFIDPSRRNENARKVYKLADCQPDITVLQSLIFQKSSFLLIKASPLLDIQQGLREVKHVKKIFVVSVGNECKELLFFAERGFEGEPLIEAVDLLENGSGRSSFSFHLTEERNANVKYGDPDHYLYEPSSSVLKSGAFKLISEKYNLAKLDVNTHLYTSSLIIQNFPGKIFRIEYLHPDAKQLKELLPDGKVNIVSRNYPLEPDEIKKKFRLRDGGSKYLIAFTAKKKLIAICSRL